MKGQRERTASRWNLAPQRPNFTAKIRIKTAAICFFWLAIWTTAHAVHNNHRRQRAPCEYVQHVKWHIFKNEQNNSEMEVEVSKRTERWELFYIFIALLPRISKKLLCQSCIRAICARLGNSSNGRGRRQNSSRARQAKEPTTSGWVTTTSTTHWTTLT